MKRLILLIALATGIVLSPAFAAKEGASNPNLKSKEARISYTLGVDIGTNFKKLGVKLDPKIVAQGIQDIMSDKTPQLTAKEMQETMLQFQKEVVAKREAQIKELANKNAKQGSKFLAANKKKKGVVTLPNGLQYKVLKKGTGPKPGKNDVVTVNYEGKLVDGKVFDSSYKRGQPVQFAVKDVIPAWSQVLQLMKTGATWMVYAPPQLAYGARGIGPIGPNETLIFKIDLVSIDKSKGASAKIKTIKKKP